uniref:Reverse transcriptase/retrotransposon-derived protein RNase H-like domain-containing protein n=1 Tax=Solanum lycopersicum TaxID=4081 RepID=A0A3Q7H8R8_SOLLC
RSKCSFGKAKVEYLGHVITKEGVTTDPHKIQAMTHLGLTGYYRKYVQNYGTISRPLTNLLKKKAFKWNSEAENAFENLKKAMMTTQVLALPDYTQEFMVETDASHRGSGMCLCNKGSQLCSLVKCWLINIEEMFRLLDTQLHYRSAYHPQSDGQTE